MTKIGTVLVNKYEILKEIGRGGMSVVYLAMDKHLNKQWAVKEIRRSAKGQDDEIVVNSLLAEANLMKRLDHPALPRIVDIIETGQTIYIVMDYIEGDSLDKNLAEYGVPSEEKVIDWAKQICDALAYLHSQKPPIIYRDMKPANVMLKPEGNIKIIDFGIAREYKEQNLADTTVLGTKGYAPPEQYSGQTDARSDIYALGMTMHHLLTGVDPRRGEGYASVRQYNPYLSEGIEIIIDKCVQPAAENRYQSCAELMYDLEHPDVITSGFKRKQKRRLAAFLASAVLCVSGLLGGFICDRLAIAENNSTYEALVSVVASTSLEDKVASYKQAIEIYPDNPEAYSKLLTAYEDAGQFGKQENAVFTALYNANKKSFDPSSLEVAQMNHQAAMLYFNYYNRSDVTDNTKERIQKAQPFFESNCENEQLPEEFENRVQAECYYTICNFYIDFVFNDTASPSRSDFEAVLKTIEAAMQDLENSGASAYDRLTMYNGVFFLLYNQKEEMADVKMQKETVLALFDEVYSKAEQLRSTKTMLKELRNDIVDHYSEYRSDIENHYANVEGRN